MPKKTEPKNPRGPRPLKAGRKFWLRLNFPGGLTETDLAALRKKALVVPTRATLSGIAHALLVDHIEGVVKDYETDEGRRRAEALRTEIEARRKALEEAEEELAGLTRVSGKFPKSWLPEGANGPGTVPQARAEEEGAPV